VSGASFSGRERFLRRQKCRVNPSTLIARSDCQKTVAVQLDHVSPQVTDLVVNRSRITSRRFRLLGGRQDKSTIVPIGENGLAMFDKLS
jgi:hypothetical protein